MFLDIIDVGSN